MSDLLRKQRRLRHACVKGDIETVEALLYPKESHWRKGLGFLGILSCPKKRRGAVSLDFVYEDDAANQPIHYICGIQPQSWLWDWPSFFRMCDWVCEHIKELFVPKQPEQGGSDKDRAKLLQWLLDKGHQIDLGVINLRGENPLHSCTRTGSHLVLKRILQSMFNETVPSDQLPCLNSFDADYHTPLDIAVHNSNWNCVRLLCASGALTTDAVYNTSQATVKSALAERVTVRAGGRLSALSNALSDMFGGSSKAKVKKLERKLERAVSSGEECGVDGQVRVLNGSQDLDELLRVSVANVQREVGLDESEASALLVAHNYNEGAAIAACRSNQEGALSAAGISRSCSLEVAETSSSKCIVCFEDFRCDANETVSLPCGHTTCNDCWRGILNVRLDEGDVHHTICAAQDCKLQLPLEAAKKLLKPHQFRRFRQLLIKRFADANPAIKWCPRAGCGNSVTFDTQSDNLLPVVLAGRPVAVECACGHRFCWLCLEPAHEPALCQQMKDWKRTLRELHEDNDSKSIYWLNHETQSCPKCRTHIQRNGGCNHMICTLCKQHFCYKCGQDWDGHGDYYFCGVAPNNTTSLTDQPLDSFLPASSEVSSRGKNLFSAIIGKLKLAANAYWWEWYLQQYSAQDCNREHVKRVGVYMCGLIHLGCPRGDEGLKDRNSSSGKMENHSGDCGGDVNLQDMYRCLLSAVDAIVTAREVLQHSYVLAFMTKRGSRKRYLENMQSQLLSAVEQLSFLLAQFPGFRQVAECGLAIEGDGAKAMLQVKEHLVSNGALLKQQFLYCMALTVGQSEMHSLIAEVNNFKGNIVKSARLGLLTKSLTNEQAEGSSHSRESSTEELLPQWLTWLPK